MPDQVTTIIPKKNQWQRCSAYAWLPLLLLTGCFGAKAMNSDIIDYNQYVVKSEQEMLLFNIGRLSNQQPPHFMMLSSVAQSRSFTAGASFTWIYLWDLLSGPLSHTQSTTRGANTFQTGVTAATAESPIFQFIPIQGAEFAQRFESPLTDKLETILEERNGTAYNDELATILMLFAQSLDLSHGTPAGPCKQGTYFNSLPRAPRGGKGYYASELSSCVNEIVDKATVNTKIESTHIVPTTAPAQAPKATNVGTTFQIPGLFDYNPDFGPRPQPLEAASPFWFKTQFPAWQELASKLPAKYQLKHYTGGNKGDLPDGYALLPEGYALERIQKGGGRVAERDFTLVPEGYVLQRTINGAPVRDKSGHFMVVPKEITVSHELTRFSYTHEIVEYFWPVDLNYVYVELRNGIVNDATAEHLCVNPDSKAKITKLNLVCGSFKIGTFFDIMQRLAEMACYPEKGDDCSQSIFGIGPKPPKWAESSASYTYRNPMTGMEQSERVWVPAHSPEEKDSSGRLGHLAERDRTAFLTLYKLYQLSLVDTSKLTTGQIPITIGK